MTSSVRWIVLAVVILSVAAVFILRDQPEKTAEAPPQAQIEEKVEESAVTKTSAALPRMLELGSTG